MELSFLGRLMALYLIGFAIVCALIGAGLTKLIPWLFHHISIAWK